VLIDHAATGDQAAFREIISRYEPLIGNILKKYDIPHAGFDQEDLRQEAVIALLGAVRSFKSEDGGVTFGLYAKICINNRMISHLRKTRKDIVPVSIRDLNESGGTDSDPENEVIAGEDYCNLLKLIDHELTAFEKSVFKLYILGKSYRGISAVLGCPQKSVDNAIYRIKNKIKKLI
jgi:RNA polymerase sporulation-specific sigma factor